MESREDYIEIQKFLPHRNPMLMVTNLFYIDETSAKSEFVIKEKCVFVKDMILSETGLIENAAQVCSAIVGQGYFEDDDLEGVSNKLVGYISAIKKVEIFSLPKVGDSIITKASLISRLDTGSVTICSMNCSTYNNDQLIVDCTMNFLIHEVL